MREEIRKLFPLEFYINNKGEMVSEISLKTLNKLSDEIIKLEEENERFKNLLNESANEILKELEALNCCKDLLNDVLQGSDDNE